MRDIKVPEGMLKAGENAFRFTEYEEQIVEKVIKAALLWLSNNPVSPTNEEFGEIVKQCRARNPLDWESLSEWKRAMYLLVEWQCRMFLAPKHPVDLNFEEVMNDLTVEVNRIGMVKSIEILREAR